MELIAVLDNKRSQMVGILISSRHLDAQEVESAVYNLDTSIIDLETLQKIFELRATDEELLAMRSTLELQPDGVLDKPEQFLLELSNIPDFSLRVACFMFQDGFFEILATISNPLNNLKVFFFHSSNPFMDFKRYHFYFELRRARNFFFKLLQYSLLLARLLRLLGII